MTAADKSLECRRGKQFTDGVIGELDGNRGLIAEIKKLQCDLKDRIAPLFSRLSRLSADPTDRLRGLSILNSAFHAVLIEHLESSLDSILRTSRPMDFQSRRAVASAANQILRETGYAIKDPETGRAAGIKVMRPSSTSTTSSFHLQDRSHAGAKTQHVTCATATFDSPIRLICVHNNSRDLLNSQAPKGDGRGRCPGTAANSFFLGD